jgi:lipid A 3-O-deacylase
MHIFRTEEFSSQISPDKFLRVGLSSDFSKFDFNKAKPPKGPLWDVISEVRFGLLSHDIKFPNRHKFRAPNPFENRYESGVNINPEVVFLSPDILDVLWAPRPHVGVAVNTDQDTNYVYTGLGWDTSWENNVFLGGFWGLAAHDGKLTNGNPDKIEFGSKVLFRLGGELGWRWDGYNGVSLIWEHMSNAGVIDEKNQGIDSLGIRYSYRFD